MTARIGIDTGGTFTDLVGYDPATGQVEVRKTPSTPDEPSRAFLTGTRELAEQMGLKREAIELLVHGATLATNAVLQRVGARTAVITTAGFRDVLHIQRQDRPRMYDLRSRRALPLASRSLRLELNERILHSGEVQTPIDREQLERIVATLKDQRVEAVAVCLLHSYVNPDHEREVGRAVADGIPEATVCLSHELVGEQGEYERFSTCVANGFVQPIMQRYLENVRSGLDDAGIEAPLFIMKSNGGVMGSEAAAQQCVQTILSGPCGGVVAGAAIAQTRESSNLITADMGGTSFDVSVIHGGIPTFQRDTEIAGLAIRAPMLDIHTVGAGGGSIAWIDSGGGLRVGPRSAGADPGPACYGRGGENSTVTDANLVLGRLAADTLLGGGMHLDLEAARRSVEQKIAGPLGLSLEDAAEGVVRVVNATMTAAIRKLTIERGHDPREFVLCAFGGAGPLHASELAAEVGVHETVIPASPGVASAMGLLMSDPREDRVSTYVGLLDEVDLGDVESRFEELDRQIVGQMRRGLEDSKIRFEMTRTLGLRYLGQSYEIAVPVGRGALDREKIRSDFHSEHEHAYGFSRPDQPVQLVSIWASGKADLGTIGLTEIPAGEKTPQPKESRKVYFRGESHDTKIYDRSSFGAGTTLTGPAIVDQVDSTTLVWPDQRVEVDRYGQMILSRIDLP